MARVDEVISNFAVYEDAVEFLGMSEATVPEVENVAEEMSGSGIGGKLESIVLGHVEAMTLTLNFRTVTAAAIKLAEPRLHRLDLRAAQQEQNTRTGIIETRSVKHILRVKPKKFSPGKLAAASAADASGEYAVYYYAINIDGVKKIEIDPLNFIYIINGIDYMKDIRKALGK